MRHAAGQACEQAVLQRRKPCEGRRPAPAQRHGHVLLAFDQIVCGEGLAQCSGHGLGVHRRLAEHLRQRHHLQVLARQQHTRLADEGGVAAELHAVLAGAEHGGADAFACRQHRPGQGAGIQALAQGFAEEFSKIAEVSRLAAVDVFADTAAEHHAGDVAVVGDGVGEHQLLAVLRRGVAGQHAHQRVGHACGHLRHLRTRGHAAQLPVEAGAAGVGAALRVQARDAVLIVDDDQAAPGVHGRRGAQFTVFDQPQLGGAAADVDVQDAALAVERAPRRARAVHRQHALHVVAGRGADELAALLGQHRSNGLAVFAPQRLAGEDDRAGVHLVRVQAGVGIGRLDERAQGPCVDQRLAQVGRQRQRRLRKRFAQHDDVACAQLVGHALQVDLAEHDLRAARADVDAHAVQDDVVLHPQRLVGAIWPVVAEVIMVVVAVVAMLVLGVVHAPLVVFQGMGAAHVNRTDRNAFGRAALVHREACAARRWPWRVGRRSKFPCP